MRSSGSKATLVSLFSLVVATLAVVLPAPPAQAAPPSNDNFASAQVIAGPGVVSGTTVEATREPGEVDVNGYSEGASVWYRWDAPGGAGDVVLEIAEATFDTTLAVYTGSSVNALTPVEWDDDAGNDALSRIELDPTPGTTYYIAVDSCCGGFGDVQTGTFDLRLSNDLPTGNVHGTVTRTSPAGPAQDICVLAVDDAGRRVAPMDTTDSSGGYSIAAPPGTVYLKFRNCGTGNLAGEYFDDAQTLAAADGIVVTQGGDHPADAVLGAGGSISGTVSADPGMPPDAEVEDVCVRATMVGGSDDGFSQQTTTDENGDYTIDGLDGGQYRVRFSGDCGANYATFAVEYWDDAPDPGAADLVSVTEGANTPDVDAGLFGVPGAIAGTVTDWTSGDPLADICVRTVSPVTSSYVETNASGAYTIPDVPAGSSWVVEFSDCNGSGPPYATQYYNNTTSEEWAEEIEVFAGQTHGLIDARMFEAGTLSGRITDPNGNGRDPACVNVHIADGQTVLGVETDVDGSWSAAVPPGNYELEMKDCGTGGLSFETRWYLDSLDQTGAQEVFVDQGDTQGNLNQVLPGVSGTDGRIIGRVTDDTAGQVPLEGICVTTTRAGVPTDTQTDAQGRYEFGNLMAGTYTVYFEQCDLDAPYDVLPQFWNDVPLGGTPTNVTVTSGDTTSGIVAFMHPAGAIEGVVENTTGDPLEDICVTAYTDPDDPGGSYVTEDFTNAAGEYQLTGLSTDDYWLTYEDCTYLYAGQWYFGVPFNSSFDITPDGDPLVVPVVAGETDVLQVTELERYGTISGTVTNEAGDPLEGICAYGWNQDDDYQVPGFGRTDADGNYWIGGLLTTTDPSNEYTVQFSDCTGLPVDYGDEYWNNKNSDATADTIAVVLGEDTPDIDAVLVSEAPVNESVPDVLGQASVGMTLKATNGTWEHDPGEFSYEWYRCESDGSNCLIADSGSPRYLISEADLGYRVRVDVTAYNSKGNATAESTLTPVIDDAAPFNDDIQDRVVFGNSLPIDIFGSNVRATRQVGEPAHLGFTEGSSVWYEWTAPTGPDAIDALQVSLAGSDFDTTLSVYDGTPVPLTGLSLVAEDDDTGENGTSVLSFAPEPGTTYYIAVDGYWLGTEAATGAVELRLSVGTGITGTVVDESDDPVRGICVEAQLASDPGIYFDAWTTTDGSYFIEAPPGTYLVSYIDCVGEYAEQWYDGVAAVEDATEVEVLEGEITPGIDATLIQIEDFGSIAGTVTNEAGQPIPNICVMAVDSNGFSFGEDYTDENGTYLVRGLGDPEAGPSDPPLEYYVSYTDCSAFYGDELYNNALDPEDATLVPVGTGEDVTGINAVLQHEAPVNTSLPTVTGSPVEGATLTATNGLWSHQPSIFEYQWMRCNGSGAACVPIAGAEDDDYITTNADVGKKLRAIVTATNSIGETDVLSLASNTVGGPTSTGLPVVTGPITPGGTLSTTDGAWTGSPTGYTYEWLRCNGSGAACVPIASATGSTYVTTGADAGHRLRSRVTATNSAGSNDALSLATGTIGAPTSTGLPVVTGPITPGGTLSTTDGAWTGSPTGYTYEWLRCNGSGAACVPIASATSSTYVTTGADAGHRLRSRVTATNSSGSNDALSLATGTIGAPESLDHLTVDGPVTVGGVLTAASNGLWTGSPTGYTYEWLRCNGSGAACVPISDADADEQTYTTTPADSGHRLRVRVTAANAIGGNSNLSHASDTIGGPESLDFPSITGSMALAGVLSTTNGAWTGAPTGYTYEWLRCNASGAACIPIPDADEQSYTAIAADSGNRLRVRVTAANAIGGNSKLSLATVVIRS